MEEIIFENFNMSENNIISVELAKVLGYLFFIEIGYTYNRPMWENQEALGIGEGEKKRKEN